MKHCPRCGSGRIASRRLLFHACMEACAAPEGFDWYHRRARGALPPRSLFLQLSVLMLGSLACFFLAAVVGLLGAHGFGAAAVCAAVLVAGGLLVDIGYTLSRYRAWARESLCADCRLSFVRDGEVSDGH